MMTMTLARETERASLKTYHDAIHLRTRECLQFIDLTDQVVKLVRISGIRDGLVNVQTKHTTTAILVNENEPMLLEDMKRILERLVSPGGPFLHDDFQVRTVNLHPNERPNGQAHCQAVLLRTSETLNIVDGELDLGKWQRIFFLELDGDQTRAVSVLVMGR